MKYKYDHFKRCKKIDKNTISFHNKKLQQIGYRGNVSQHNKGQTAQLTQNSTVKS